MEAVQYHVTFWGNVDNPGNRPAAQIFQALGQTTISEPVPPAVAMTPQEYADYLVFQEPLVAAWEAANPVPAPDPIDDLIERLETDEALKDQVRAILFPT